MNVSLTPELEAAVKARVASGRYNNASEVVRDALRALEEREDREAESRAIKDAYERGMADFAAGRYTEVDDIAAFINESYDAAMDRFEAVKAAPVGRKV